MLIFTPNLCIENSGEDFGCLCDGGLKFVDSIYFPFTNGTIDGSEIWRSPVNMLDIPSFTGFFTSQEVVWISYPSTVSFRDLHS